MFFEMDIKENIRKIDKIALNSTVNLTIPPEGTISGGIDIVIIPPFVINTK